MFDMSHVSACTGTGKLPNRNSATDDRNSLARKRWRSTRKIAEPEIIFHNQNGRKETGRRLFSEFPF